MWIASALLICFASNAFADKDIVRLYNFKVLLYTPQNPDVPIPLQTANLSEITVTVAKQVKFIVHGWNDDSRSSWVTQMVNAYVQQGHVVIFTDWSYYSTNLVYWLVLDFVRDVGNIIGNLIINMMKAYGFGLSQVECIGHSLGAHACGFAGKHLIEKGKKIGNITGLDPAGPGYENEPASYHLDKNDANIVKVMHTNAGAEGIIKTIGTIDFFPNGGIVQPNCLPVDSNCSHFASLNYWTNGINSDQYVATKCPTYLLYQIKACRNNPTAIMASGTDAQASGVFFLQT